MNKENSALKKSLYELSSRFNTLKTTFLPSFEDDGESVEIVEEEYMVNGKLYSQKYDLKVFFECFMKKGTCWCCLYC